MKWMAEYNFEDGKAMNIRMFATFEDFRKWMNSEKPDSVVELYEMGDMDTGPSELQHHTYIRIY